MAGEVSLVADVSGVLGVIQHVRPQLFLGVPRIWEKFQSGLLNRLESEPNVLAGEESHSARRRDRSEGRAKGAGGRADRDSASSPDSGCSIGSSSARCGTGWVWTIWRWGEITAAAPIDPWAIASSTPSASLSSSLMG